MCYFKRMEIAARQRPPAGTLHLDHVAHFVPDLGAAGDLLEALGFAPTPVSHHQVNGKPAGTSNRCLMLEEGYIEILSPTLDTPNARRARTLMARYPGVHLVCFGTQGAEADFARLAAHGFKPEPVVPLARKISRNRLLRFKVIYLPPGTMPEGRIQYCEHLTPQYLWDKPSLAHRNGVKGLASVYVVAKDPAAAAARWGEYAGLLPRPDGKLVRLDCARGQIFIGTKKTLSAFIDEVPPVAGVAAIGFRFRNPEAFAEKCRKLGLKPKKTRRGYSLSLPPALGGTWIF
jgi:hypothetical protein